jgi:polysaccharide export outer membrane protein
MKQKINNQSRNSMTHMIRIFRLLAIPIFLLSGCAKLGIDPQVSEIELPPQPFQVEQQEEVQKFASAEFIRELSKEKQDKKQYQLGPGDVLDISVWRRPEISRDNVIVAPDGVISMPQVGILNVNGMTIAEATSEIRAILSRGYENPEVSLLVREYHNNKAFVLGRVSEPGVVNFPGDGTLLEALALAGGLPHIGKDTFLTKCAIIRDNDTVIWIDLRDLLDHGNMALNAKILNNDVIFIPEAEDEMVLVLGEVRQAGPVMLKRGLNIIDALMRSGGYTEEADLEKIFVLRQNGDEGYIEQVNLKTMLETGDLSQNYALQRDDIVYVSPTGMRKFNYAMEQLLPSLSVLSLSADILDNLGLTERLIRVRTDDENE